MAHFFWLVALLAHHAILTATPLLRLWPRQVIAALGAPGNQRRRQQRGEHGDQRGKRLRGRAKGADKTRHRQHRGQTHRSHPHRVDVVQMGAAKLNAGRAQPQGFVDHQIRHHRRKPGNGDIGIQPQHLANGLEHLQLHQQQGNQDIEHHPHHPAGVAVGQPREKVRPRQRAGIGIGDVDFQLRQNHKQRGHPHRQRRRMKHLGKRRQIHLIGVHRPLRRHALAQQQPGQQSAAQHLGHPRQHPTRPAQRHRQPPTPLARALRRRHKAQIIRLLAHLGDQGHPHRQGRAKALQIKPGRKPTLAAIRPQTSQRLRIAGQHHCVRQHQQSQPQRQGPQLHPADGGDAVHNQRNHHQGAQQIPPRRRQTQAHLQRISHDRRFQGKKDKGERGVNQRSNGRADITKPGAPSEQIHVHAKPCGTHADRPPRQRDDQTGGKNRPERIDEPRLHQHGRANRLQHQKRRRPPKRRLRHPPHRPLTKTARSKTQRVILQRLPRHPTVVIPTHLDNTLRGRAVRRIGHGQDSGKTEGEIGRGPARWRSVGRGRGAKRLRQCAVVMSGCPPARK